MSLLDVLIVVLLALAVAHGITQGAALQVFSFGGFWLGMLFGAWLAPVFAGLTDSAFGSAFLSLLVFLGFALMGGASGRFLGTHAGGLLHRWKLRQADAALGAVVSMLAALAAVWLLAIVLAAGPTRSIASAVNDSAIVRTLVSRLPPAPSVFSRLQRFIDTTPFPRVFEGLEPIPAGPIDLPDDPVVQAAVAAAGQSTVRVVGLGCGGVQTGSGFVAGPGLVVTNAHVVAGIDEPVVEDSNGNHRAEAVLFDPQLDIAVLRTDGLAGQPLGILRTAVDRGQGGAVLGYPGGGQFQAGAAGVLRRFSAVGRDIYGRDLTRRDVYQLQAQIRQGNSGGPFVRDDGVVLGLIFAASTTDDDIGYALTSEEVVPRVEEAQNQTQEVDTGPCAA